MERKPEWKLPVSAAAETFAALWEMLRLAAATIFVALCGTFLFPAAALAQTFSDVPFGSWFYADVEALVSSGVINGSVPEYRPGDNVNRAEMAKLIVEAYDLPLGTPDFETFLDVPRGQWYFSYVETVALQGIAVGYLDTNGDLNNLFGPHDPITREQAAKMIVLGAEISINTGCGAVFQDVAPERWSYEYIGTLFANSILGGYPDGSFRPEQNINRAEIAKIMNQSQTPKLRTCAGQEQVKV